MDSYYAKIVKRDDQGDTPYNLRCCAYWDDFSKQVIAWQRITQKPTFCLTDNGLVVLDSMAFLSNIKNKYKNWLLAVLNSDLIYFWVKMNVHEYGNTGFRLSNQYVEDIPISILSKSDLERFEQMYGIDKNSDKEIQNFIYDIYNISIEEQLFIKERLS